MEYRGLDAHGASVHGRLPDNRGELLRWIQRRFRIGWSRVVILRDGVEVGGIVRDGFAAPMWWIE
jgi:hypothetical protein